MSINPTGNYQAPIVMTERNTSIPVKAPVIAKSSYEPEYVASAKFDEDGTLKISSAIKNAFDSNVWLTINPDGSSFEQTCWSPRRGEKPEGTYSEVYQKALELKEADGTISDENSLALLEMYKNVEDKGLIQ